MGVVVVLLIEWVGVAVGVVLLVEWVGGSVVVVLQLECVGVAFGVVVGAVFCGPRPLFDRLKAVVFFILVVSLNLRVVCLALLACLNSDVPRAARYIHEVVMKPVQSEAVLLVRFGLVVWWRAEFN